MLAPLRWWEERSTPAQVVISAIVFGLIFFFLNYIPFSQPLFRSLSYAVIEGGVFVAIAVWATHAEHQSRLRRAAEARAAAEGGPTEDPIPREPEGPLDPELEAWLDRTSRR